MALIKATDGGQDDECVEMAERHLVDALRAVEAVTQKIRQQELDALAEVPKLAAQAAQATKQLLSEKTRVHELQKRNVGIVRDFALDLDAARDEVGRRLACLRAAGDG
jgi:conjugal transfer/entry exclusion protein